MVFEDRGPKAKRKLEELSDSGDLRVKREVVVN